MTTKNYPLRKAQAENYQSILDLLKKCELPNNDISVADLTHYFLVENEHELIGTIGLEEFDACGLLRSLAIKEKYRNKGLGERLVNELENHAVQLGIRELYLLTTTADSYFSKLGYNKIARDQAPESIQSSEEFANICPSTAAFMKKTLTQP